MISLVTIDLFLFSDINPVSPFWYPNSIGELDSHMSDSFPCISLCLNVYHHLDHTLKICKISLFSCEANFMSAIIVNCDQGTHN